MDTQDLTSGAGIRQHQPVIGSDLGCRIIYNLFVIFFPIIVVSDYQDKLTIDLELVLFKTSFSQPEYID